VAPEDLRRIARDIEATLVDQARKSIAWSEVVQLALDRLANIDPITARRLAANYADDSGAVRFDDNAPAAESPQLGLPLADDED
jgi:transcriptional regulator NrdR family protein